MANVIGFLQSAGDDKFVAPFKEGLDDGGLTNATLDVKLGGNYGSNIKNNAEQIKSANGANLKLVVAGGTFAGLRAVEVWPTGLPLLVVSGRKRTEFDNRSNTGGYVLENTTPPSMNSTRVKLLKDVYGIANPQVCLLYNQNSAMSAAEVADWTTNINQMTYNAASAQGVPTGPQLANEEIDIQKSVRRAADKINGSGALVVSSDPFFTQSRRKILKAAADLNDIVMCYPIFDYLMALGEKRRTVILGPLLEEVYYNLGKQAAAIIKDGQPVQTMIRANPYYFGKQPTTPSLESTLSQFGQVAEHWTRRVKESAH
jgi:hypothetical protein